MGTAAAKVTTELSIYLKDPLSTETVQRESQIQHPWLSCNR